MITQTLEAVFEHGVFRPLTSLNIPVTEGQQVRLVVEAAETLPEALVLATQVYDGLTEKQIDEVEQIILDRRSFFGDRVLV